MKKQARSPILEGFGRNIYALLSFSGQQYFEKGHGAKPEPEDDFFVTQWTDKGWVRGQGIFDQEPPCFYKDYSAAMQDMNVPLISHEIGQYAVFPNLKEIEKYTGVLEPLNFKAVKQDFRMEERRQNGGRRRQIVQEFVKMEKIHSAGLFQYEFGEDVKDFFRI